MPYPNNAPNIPYGGPPNQPPRSVDFNLPPPGFNGPPQGKFLAFLYITYSQHEIEAVHVLIIIINFQP